MLHLRVKKQLKELQGIIERKRDEIVSAWEKHFKS